MKQTITACAVFLMACMPAVAFGATGDVADQVKKLERAYEAMKDMQASFQQQTSSGAVAVVQQASGRIYFKKQGKMLWKYEAPEEQHIILDGKTLWVYQPEEKQAMKNNFNTVPQHIVIDLFRGRIDILERYRAAFAQSAPGAASSQVVLELMPIEPDPTLASLVLWLDPATSLVRRSCLTDAFGNRTELTFEDIRIDQGLPDSLFEFTPPRGIDIFEPPQQ